MRFILASMAATGVHLVFTRSHQAPSRRATAGSPSRWHRLRARFNAWLAQVGLADVDPREFVAVLLALFFLGFVGGFVLFGGIAPAAVVGVFAASFPVATFRHRRRQRRSLAMEAWPRMIEEIRILTGSLGRSIPQALFDVGQRAPDELRPAFETAHREWLLTTEFERTLSVLKSQLADPTADATCETLLVAYSIGGGDLDGRLEALAEDRRQDVAGRKDARAKQAGVRFARRFVLIVPVGMALAGMSVGPGRAAYQSAMGQTFVVVGILLVVACWLWAGRLLQIPESDRVFAE